MASRLVRTCPAIMTEHGRCNLMRSSREGAAGSPMGASGTGPSSITDSDDPLMLRPAGPGAPGGPRRQDRAGTPGSPDGIGPLDGQQAAAARCRDGEDSAEPLTESDAEAVAHGICFKTGPPGGVGVELEWLVCDGRDPAVPVDQRRVATALTRLDSPGALPGRGVLTSEPGGQIELSSAPAAGLGDCVAVTCQDLAVLRNAVHQAGLCLTGHGLDPYRPPQRVLELPRYAAMEEFFDRAGPSGRLMMCSTASVQVCLDAGDEGPGWAGFRWRWHLLHAIGPVLVAAFANSPLHGGLPTGWKSTRQAIWARLDPTRTLPPAMPSPHPEPAGPGRRPPIPVPPGCPTRWLPRSCACGGPVRPAGRPRPG